MDKNPFKVGDIITIVDDFPHVWLLDSYEKDIKREVLGITPATVILNVEFCDHTIYHYSYFKHDTNSMRKLKLEKLKKLKND